MDEAPRPDPGFRVWVERPDSRGVDVTFAVMDAFDVAVNSLDFGSGFLSTEEALHLRELAKAIGADPSPFRTTSGSSALDASERNNS